MLTKDKDIFLLFKLMGIGIVVIIIIYILTEKWKSSEYPFITFEQSINGKIIDATPFQSIVYIKLSDGSQFRLTSSRNYLYEPYQLNEFLKGSDFLVKKNNNDSLQVIRESHVYVFVLGQDLNKSQRKDNKNLN